MKDPNVDEFIQSADKWSAEMAFLRRILLDCLLVETYKWKTPVYMVGTKNLIAISPLKDHCALNFFNGALLQNEEGLLIKPGEHTQLGRWMKFSSVDQILAKEELIKAYILEAIEVEKLGLKMGKSTEIPYPEELTAIFDKNRICKRPSRNSPQVASAPIFAFSRTGNSLKHVLRASRKTRNTF